MSTGILLTARLGSSRLKQKHLLAINGQPILAYLIRRIQHIFQQELAAGTVKIVIATADETENRQFESFCSQGVGVFYGSPQNIPLRHLQAADAYGFSQLIAVDGDDILCSPMGMQRVYQALITDCQYVKTQGLPFGMNVAGYSRDFLAASVSSQAAKVLETGWGRIFDEAELVTIDLTLPIPHEHMRFTLDYPEDFSFFSRVLSEFPGNLDLATDLEFVEYVQKQHLYEITQPVSEKYWDNFNSGVEKEQE